MNSCMYIGNYTNEGIIIINENAKKSCKEGILKNNSFIYKYGECIYSAVEINDKSINSGYISAYRIKDNDLEYINSKSSMGIGPCHVIVNTKYQLLFASNYLGGSYAVYEICEDGSIGEVVSSTYFGENSRVHQIQFSNDLKFFYVVDLGENCIIENQINVSNKDGFTIKELTRFYFEEDIKPRHMVVDKEDNLFIITEKSCEIYKLKHENSKLILDAQRSTIPGIELLEDYTGCAIRMSKDGRHLYTSIRGHNSISVFRIDDGFDLIQNLSCYGECPRDIVITDDNKCLICANQQSNNLSFFKIENGELSFEKKIDIDSPTCICLD